MSIFIALSSNLDDPPQRLKQAIQALADHPSLQLIKTSSIYRTIPWGLVEQPDFYNAVCQIETPLSAQDLLNELQNLERQLGRAPQIVRWGPRRIDLDILLYHNHRINEPGLVVPHPLMRERAFVLVPLLEIAPDLVDPVTGEPLRRDLERVRKPGDVVKID